MRATRAIVGGVVLLCVTLGLAFVASAQDGASGRTMRPVIRGEQYAVTSMKAPATAAAVRILEAGGDAFDAAVAGQAVLALVDPASNGIGSDAVLLVYDAESKQVLSINAEGTAPKLATIEWYEKNNDGELPRSDGLLSASIPTVVDSWYILLDRNMVSFEPSLHSGFGTGVVVGDLGFIFNCRGDYYSLVQGTISLSGSSDSPSTVV